MKTATIALNVILFTFTCLVIVTDGPPRDAIYIAFNVLLLVVPVATIATLARARNPGVVRSVVALNVVLFASVIAAIVDQYPHPDEPGLVAFIVVCILTPLVGAVTLLVDGGRRASMAV